MHALVGDNFMIKMKADQESSGAQDKWSMMLILSLNKA